MRFSEDPYLYPGTEVLRNRLGIRDSERLTIAEATATARRLLELRREPITGQFDLTHLQQIHRYLFQDIYEWAGEFRTVNLAKSAWFARPEFIAEQLKFLFDRLAVERSSAETDQERFVHLAAFCLGELNAVHPFREGNGRTQREFIRQLGAVAGFSVRWSRISKDHMIEASRLSMVSADRTMLVQILRQACAG